MIRIVSQNVHGLRDFVKRKEILYFLRNKAEIVCLQETYSTKEDCNLWKSMWNGPIYYSHGTNKSRGVLIACKRNSDFEILDFATDDVGRYIILQIKANEKKFILVNLYAPNRDCPELFVEIFRKVEKIGR